MAALEFIIDGHKVLIDEDDAYILARYSWRAPTNRNKTYVRCDTRKQGKKVYLLLHREILGLKVGDKLQADHINGDSLDNRRENLRVVTPRQNNLNSKKKYSKHGNRFRGISTRKYGFPSQIRVNGKLQHLGTYKTDVEAAYAYDMASIEHHGEFGRRNFLPLVR